MIYYARSKNMQGQQETVSHHLYRCGELAEKFAEGFGNALAGLYAGRMHDVGKYSMKFQKVLERDEHGINHAAAGAFFLWQKGKEKMSSVYYQLAVAVYAHHSRLEYFIADKLKESWRDEDTDDGEKRFAVSGREQYAKCMELLKEENILPKGMVGHRDYSNYIKSELGKMLYIRMIYSCLVDADYSSSAEHFDKDYLLKSALPKVDFKQAIIRLEDYRDKIRKNSNANGIMKQLRDQVYGDCLNAAKQKPGLFTLTAPTGTGKTLALLKFALEHAVKYGKERIIIVLPFLSIIEQNATQYKEICKHVLEVHSSVDYAGMDSKAARELSSRWAASVIVTTSVCFFETLFRDLPADLRKLHTYSNSVIVFDEAQSLPCNLVGASLDAINGLCEDYNATVLFSTATQPSFHYRSDVRWNPYEICNHIKELFFKAKRTEVEWRINSAVPFKAIAEEMSQCHSCCAIVNLKKHAIKLFQALNHISKNVFYISTDLCVENRRDVLKQINQYLKEGKECRIVSTQCIEAGVDLDVEVMFRALAPLDAIIQSAGRCNRGGKLLRGKIIVFEPEAEGNMYPSADYEAAANIVQLLLHRHDGEIDVDEPKIVDEYYQLLFGNKINGSDKKNLVEAISELNFEKTSKEYHLIDNAGYSVIVPYAPQIELYQSVCEKARKGGLTSSLMAEAAKITVNSYDKDSVMEKCENIKVYSKYGKEGTNWYILNDSALYKEKSTGLNLLSEEGFNNML